MHAEKTSQLYLFRKRKTLYAFLKNFRAKQFEFLIHPSPRNELKSSGFRALEKTTLLFIAQHKKFGQFD